jgi:hypothetical protein
MSGRVAVALHGANEDVWRVSRVSFHIHCLVVAQPESLYRGDQERYPPLISLPGHFYPVE